MAARTPKRRSRGEMQAENRARLLDAAWKLFHARGFGAATLDEIARAAGLTIGAVYSNFRNKAELFLAMIEAEEISVADLSAAAGDFDSSADRFEALGRSLYAQGATDPLDVALLVELYAFTIRNVDARAAVGATVADAMAPLIAGLDPLLAAASARIDGRQLVALVQATLDGLSLHRALSPGLVDEELYAAAFRGIGALLDADLAAG